VAKDHKVFSPRNGGRKKKRNRPCKSAPKSPKSALKRRRKKGRGGGDTPLTKLALNNPRGKKGKKRRKR